MKCTNQKFRDFLHANGMSNPEDRCINAEPWMNKSIVEIKEQIARYETMGETANNFDRNQYLNEAKTLRLILLFKGEGYKS
ncbi:MAG: hypothetical protein ACYC3O_07675 [Burkholderiales bacterium]